MILDISNLIIKFVIIYYKVFFFNINLFEGYFNIN